MAKNPAAACTVVPAGTEKLRRSATHKRATLLRSNRMATPPSKRTRCSRVETRPEKKRDSRDQIPKTTPAAMIRVGAATAAPLAVATEQWKARRHWPGRLGSRRAVQLSRWSSCRSACNSAKRRSWWQRRELFGWSRRVRLQSVSGSRLCLSVPG